MAAIDDYLSQLDQELRRRGIDDPRTLAEAREHLIDAVEEGRGRGLSLEDAEREALDRFGAPAVVAAHAHEEGNRPMRGFVAFFAVLWQGKWWVLVPTLAAAIVAGVTSSFVPNHYRAETMILVVPQRVPEDYVRSVVTLKIEDRLRSLNQQIRSRTRLERIIEDFNLYPDRRKTDIMQNIVDDMSDDIDIDIVHDNVFRVAFTSDDPRTAMQVTDRLATFLIDESLRDRTVLTEGTTEFIETQIADLRRRIVETEATLETLRGRNDEPLSQADLIPYEMLKESYRALLLKQQDARVAANLERRQIGEQFRILEPARLPDVPSGPNRMRAVLMSALIGLALGLVAIAIRRAPNTRPPALAEA